ncbi:MAG: hypothetical protein MJY99_03695 [Fibrobacter sp.]|nr:hypothetical protein [Fibrobacter sp.]
MHKFTLFAILSVLAALFVACDDSSSGASNADEQAEANSSESTTDEGISSANDVEAFSSITENTIMSSSTEDFLGESSSSEIIQENLSNGVNKSSSSETTSSSSEMESSSSEDAYTFYDSRLNTEWKLYRYDGDSSEVQKAGRFGIIYEGTAFSCRGDIVGKKLEELGAEYWHENCPHYGETNGEFYIKSTKDIKKYVLDSLIEGFFNSYSVDDTNKIEIEFDPRDWQETVRICDEEKNCHYETIEKDSVHLTIYFWEDVSAEGCEEVVSSCGVNALEPCPFYFIDVMAPKSSIECLETSRDIQDITPPQHGDVL